MKEIFHCKGHKSFNGYDEAEWAEVAIERKCHKGNSHLNRLLKMLKKRSRDNRNLIEYRNPRKEINMVHVYWFR